MDTDKKASEETGLTIHKKTDGRLYVNVNDKDTAVRVQPCFPWSYPRSYISLRDDDDNEIAMVDDMQSLDGSSGNDSPG